MSLIDPENMDTEKPCSSLMSEYIKGIHQIDRNQHLLLLLVQHFKNSQSESYLNLLKSLERAIKLQQIKIRSILPTQNKFYH